MLERSTRTVRAGFLFSCVSALLVPATAGAFSGGNHKEITDKVTASYGFGPQSAGKVWAGNAHADESPLDVDKASCTVKMPSGEWFKAEAHFDDETFSAGAARLRAKFDLVVSSLGKCKKDTALEGLGRAFHGIQDFFSHSNFVVIMPNAKVDLLHLNDPTPAERAQKVDCATGKGPLTSGYYNYTEAEVDNNLSDRLIVPGNRCMHGDLAKDTAGDKPGVALHNVAKQRAGAESAAFLERIKARLKKEYPKTHTLLWGFLTKDNADACQCQFAVHSAFQTQKVVERRVAINWGNGKAYFFKGDKYIRYDLKTEKPDPGYPAPIAGNWKGLWPSGIDAALKWGNVAYFFKGGQYAKWDIAKDAMVAGYPKPVNASTWPGLWTSGIDAAVDWGNGKAYFFKGSQYLRYDIATEKPDPGYPSKFSAQSWPGLCTNGIDGVVNWGNGKAYFFKGDQYFRYDINADKADPGYPQPVNAASWPGLQ